MTYIERRRVIAFRTYWTRLGLEDLKRAEECKLLYLKSDYRQHAIDWHGEQAALSFQRAAHFALMLL